MWVDSWEESNHHGCRDFMASWALLTCKYHLLVIESVENWVEELKGCVKFAVEVVVNS